MHFTADVNKSSGNLPIGHIAVFVVAYIAGNKYFISEKYFLQFLNKYLHDCVILAGISD